MKPLWISLAILATVIGCLFANTHYLENLVKPWQAQLTQAEAYADAGDWQSAIHLSEEIDASVQDRSLYLHITLPHDDLDQISLLLAEALAYLEEEKIGEYSATNTALLRRMSLLYEMEKLTIENIF